MRKQLINFYLEFINDFLTMQTFADYHNLSVNDAFDLLQIGKRLHEENVSLKLLTNP
jgi:hypothetical protein